MAEKYAWWAAGGWPLKYVFCTWNGQTVADALALTDAAGAPLRANCLYRMERTAASCLKRNWPPSAR